MERPGLPRKMEKQTVYREMAQKLDLTRELVQQLYEKETPFFVFDLDRVKEKIELVRKTINPDKIFYAIKSNSIPKILETISDEGLGFEINNTGELEKVITKNSDTGNIINSSPISGAKDVQALYSAGVREFCFDTKEQIENLAHNAPGTDVYLRIYNENYGSRFKLNRLGVHTKDAMKLIDYAKEKGLNPSGITFHVGSQCCNDENWKEGIYQASILFEKYPGLNHLNIGGGIPVSYNKEVPRLEDTAKIINESIDKYFDKKPELRVEPGRFLVGDAGTTWSSVIQHQDKKEISRVVTDMSIFSGFIEILEIKNGFQYPITTDSNGPVQKYQIEGCTCAGTDIIAGETELPKLHVDYKKPENSSRIIFGNTGAYSLDYIGKNGSNGFNGARIPEIYFIQGGRLL